MTRKSEKNLFDKKGPYRARRSELIITHHTLNTIAGRFVGNDESSSSRKRYVRQVMYVVDALPTESRALVLVLCFSLRVVEGIITHEGDPMVINLKIHYSK